MHGHLIRYFLVLLAFASLAGCAALEGRREIPVGGLVFENQTPGTVHNVVLRALETKAVASCSRISAGDRFSTTFPVRRYQGGPLVVTWEHRGVRRTSGEFVIAPPADVALKDPVTVLILIAEGGSSWRLLR
jgi:hypothetical protein